MKIAIIILSVLLFLSVIFSVCLLVENRNQKKDISEEAVGTVIFDTENPNQVSVYVSFNKDLNSVLTKNTAIFYIEENRN